MRKDSPQGLTSSLTTCPKGSVLGSGEESWKESLEPRPLPVSQCPHFQYRQAEAWLQVLEVLPVESPPLPAPDAVRAGYELWELWSFSSNTWRLRPKGPSRLHILEKFPQRLEGGWPRVRAWLGGGRPGCKSQLYHWLPM